MSRRAASANVKENEPVSSIDKDSENTEPLKQAKGKKAAGGNNAKTAGKRGTKAISNVDETEDLPLKDSEDVAEAPAKASRTAINAKAPGKKGTKTVSIVEDSEELNDEDDGSTMEEEEAIVEDEVEEKDEPPPKPKRGGKRAGEDMAPRKGRKVVETVEEPSKEEFGTDEEDTPQETVNKGKAGHQPAKGRKGKKEAEKKEEDGDEVEEKAGEEEFAPKGRGGRRAAAAKPVAEPEKDEDEEAMDDEKPAPVVKGRKGKREAKKEDAEEAEEKVAPKGRGGRKVAAPKPVAEPEEDEDEEMMDDEKPASAKGKKDLDSGEPDKKKPKNEAEKKKPVGKGRARAVEQEEEEEEEEEVVKPAVKGRGKKNAVVAKDDEEKEDEKPAGRAKRTAASKAEAAMKKADEDDKKDAAKSAPKRGRGKKAAAAADEEDVTPSKQIKKEEEDEESAKSNGKSMTKSIRRTVEVKGKAAVDPLCTRKASTSHVYVDGELIYDVMLNQTNIGNNNNKYYVIQLLEDDTKNEYSVWFRWGRVGYDGLNKLVECGTNLQRAIKEFSDKFEAKTRNSWPTSFSDFETYPGKYTMIEMDYGNGSNEGDSVVKMEEEQEEEETKCKVESKLDKRVQQLIHLICSIRTMSQAVKSLEFDAEKSPLGKITQQQIKEGYACLGRVEEFIKKESFGTEFKQAVNEYYTKIPHACGFRPPALIKTPKQLKNEIELLDLLSDIEYAIKTMKQETKEEDVHPVDRHYASLKCALNPIEKAEQEFEVVSEYLAKTHGDTHAFEMKLQNVYRVEREGEEENDEMMEKIGNKKLLWHGSRLSNFFGILSQGLRIAPPEAPSTGYMFGKGVYFADMASKSGGYCYTNADDQTAFLLLAEVALGEENQLKVANYDAHKLPSKKSSTWGVGRTMPDPREDKEILNKVKVPCGKPISNPFGTDGSLLYNEFIVYNTQQIRMRYLVEVKFSHNY